MYNNFQFHSVLWEFEVNKLCKTNGIIKHSFMRLNAANANKYKMLNRTDIVVHKSGTAENCGNKKFLKYHLKFY